MNKDLNAVSSEYAPNAATETENNLILNWYPHRMIARFGYVPSLLELGLGHGYTARIFVAGFSVTTILEFPGSLMARTFPMCITPPPASAFSKDIFLADFSQILEGNHVPVKV